ncbi:MAG: cysteate synthase [Candidatus Marinimicrobia bacterium]|nr:cysteate synthase [Candidatus Neomarinimicrobiota bacterium]
MKTNYKLKCLGCGEIFDDNQQLLHESCEEKAFLRAIYDKKQIELKDDSNGLYKFADWLPINHTLEGSGAPITYKSKKMCDELGLENLFITFSGYWPKKNAKMLTGSFKECEAYSVCGRLPEKYDKTLVVASAGNTAKAFAKVCSDNNLPLVIVIPEDSLKEMFLKDKLNPCVKLVVAGGKSDYYDAIKLADLICNNDGYFPEGGAKNVARRDGMGTTVLSATTTIGEIPDYYFQAVGSATGAISAWEANLRLIEDGNYGNKKMKLMISQNAPFLLLNESWKRKSRELFNYEDKDARAKIEIIDAKVLSNRKPPYGLIGGLFDALSDTNGETLFATNEEAKKAKELFYKVEGIDISSAPAVAFASLIKAKNENKIKKDAIISLNITGGGNELFKKENRVNYFKPTMTFKREEITQEIVDKKIQNL